MVSCSISVRISHCLHATARCLNVQHFPFSGLLQIWGRCHDVQHFAWDGIDRSLKDKSQIWGYDFICWQSFSSSSQKRVLCFSIVRRHCGRSCSVFGKTLMYYDFSSLDISWNALHHYILKDGKRGFLDYYRVIAKERGTNDVYDGENEKRRWKKHFLRLAIFTDISCIIRWKIPND